MMESNTSDKQKNLTAILRPRTTGEYIAHYISKIGSPPVMSLAGIVLIALNRPRPGIWTWAALYVGLTLLLPVAYLIWLIRKEQVTDLDVHLREQRSRPFIVAVSGQLAAWLLAWLGGAPDPLPLITAASFLQMFLILLITLRWKISVHTSTAAGVSVMIWQLIGPTGLYFALSVPFIAWSRIKLRRHTFPQTMAGMLLGSTIFTVLAYFFG
jgi:hypothetical protein